MDNNRELVPTGLSPDGTLEAFAQLQNFMASLPQTELTPVNHFAPGVYARELTIPADTVAIGKTHGKEHLLIVVKGDVTIVTDQGRHRIRAPAVFTSPAGVKRALYTHEDTTFITIHPTDETDLDKIEADIIVPDKVPALEYEERIKLKEISA